MNIASPRFRTCFRVVILTSTLLILLGSSQGVDADRPSQVNQASAASEIKTQTTNDGILLEIGKPIEKRLAVGQTDSYCLTLTQGQYVHVVIEQKGVDVEVVLLGPDGNKLDEVDSPNGKYGTEPLSFIATVSGSYRVKVCSQEEDPGGRYEIRIADLRIATEQDQKRSLAGKWYRQGTLLQ